MLAPAMDKKYSSLSNEGEKMSANFLFGEQEDLEKRMKEIDDSAKLAKKMKGSEFRGRENKSVERNNYPSGSQDNRTPKKFSFKKTFLAGKAQHHQKTQKGKKPKGGLGHQKS